MATTQVNDLSSSSIFVNKDVDKDSVVMNGDKESHASAKPVTSGVQAFARSTSINTNRRPDEPTELSFGKQPENEEERSKRKDIEDALADATTSLKDWQHFAKTDYGLISDDLRRIIWPRLVGIDPAAVEPPPSLDQLRTHPEYNQVILDVNRSLKRFPPGIPYEQRIALQDQLTVLILRVIIKHPELKYYQGYHDVAVTFLLVVGDEVAFDIMAFLSTHHLVECMQETMEPTQRRLMFLYPLVRYERPALCDYLEKSTVGTLFALPWYLTWFGHSLNSYRDVVRLYDYFLASSFLLPIYLTASIVLYREDEIFAEDCDMASMHCVLSKLPDNLPFEYLMRQADDLYKRYPPDVVELDVQKILVREKEQRKVDEARAAVRRKEIAKHRLATSAAAAAASNPIFYRFIPQALLTRRSLFMTTTAFSIFVGICAYYYKAVGIS